MAEPTIRVKLIPDTTGLMAGLAGTPVGLVSGGDAEAKKQAAMITVPITDVLSGILKGMNKLAEASPQLAASLDLLGKGIMFALRPIGDIFAQLIRPMAMILIRFFGPLAANIIKEGSFIKGVRKTIGEDPGGAIKATLILGGIALGIGGLAATGATFLRWASGLLGLGTPIAGAASATGGVGALALPAALIIGTLLFGGIFGGLVGGKSGAIVGVIAGLIGLGFVFALGATGGIAIAIPLAFVVTGVLGFVAFKKMIKDFTESDVFKALKKPFETIGKIFGTYKDIKAIQRDEDPALTEDLTETERDLVKVREENNQTMKDGIQIYQDTEGILWTHISAEEAATAITKGLGDATEDTSVKIDGLAASLKKGTAAMMEYSKWWESLPISTKRAVSRGVSSQVFEGRNIEVPRRGGGGFSEMMWLFGYGQQMNITNIGNLYGLSTSTGGT